MYDVFISYSVADSNIAMRVYYDLVRSGVKAYLFEKEAEIGVPFNQEIYDTLDHIKFFCLFDSPHARSSTWVRKECDYALSRKTAVIQCVVEERKEWFHRNELFNGQAFIQGIDMFGIDRLDYRNIYRSAIETLCSIFNSNYTPWSDYPAGRDFEKEVTLHKVPDNTKLFLMSDYSNFVYSVKIASDTSLNRIDTLIYDCQAARANVAVCYLAKGKILADIDRDTEAKDVYEKMTAMFPDDARGWTGLSAAQFYTFDLVSSLQSIDTALELIERDPLNNNNWAHKPEQTLKKFQLLLAMKRYVEARALFDRELKHMVETPELRIAEVKLELMERNSISPVYRKVVKSYQFQLNEHQLNRLIGDLEYHIARHFAERGDYISAILHYETAVIANPSAIQCMAELCMVLHSMADSRKTECLKKGLALKPSSANDDYYYGLLLFLAGQHSQAEQCYRRSGLQWLRYSELFI